MYVALAIVHVAAVVHIYILVGKKVSSRQGVTGRGKQITGVRKIWGTKKGVSCNDVAKAMVKAVGRVSSSVSRGPPV